VTSVVPFTNNYDDLTTTEGYQFEFNCMRCGNGYKSKFRHSVTGFGGRLLNLGGGILGGKVGDKMDDIGWGAEWMRDRTGGGTTKDKRLAEAVEDVRPYFTQCHRCGQWVCNDICWNGERGLCCDCAPKLDQEIAGMQAEAQRRQLEDRVQQQDWTGGINVVDEKVGLCSSCNQESGGGKFCQSCGAGLNAAPTVTRAFCANCGSKLGPNSVFCGECGTSAL
jgi:hypothetical protein